MTVEEVGIQLVVNDRKVSVSVPPKMTLLQLLREHLGLTGAKPGCLQGDCGSCVVIVDGKAISSCLMLAVQADGKQVRTVEGLKAGDLLHPLQEAFLEEGALQCGYCTPGLLMSAAALLEKNPRPSEREIRDAISGNLCRCTGYHSIVRAIRRVAEQGESDGQ